ncbi:hypothetical protein OSTOST_11973 [Ostertagia ostertagi]
MSKQLISIHSDGYKRLYEWVRDHTRRTRMASVPPGDINTQPNSKIVFNAPYDDKHTYHIKIINASGRRIGWAIKTTNMRDLVWILPAVCSIPRRPPLWLSPVMCSTTDVRTPTTTVSLSNGATLLTELPSNSVVNGSKEMVWSEERTFLSSTIPEIPERTPLIN